jgi:hypothetical protein
MSELKRNVLARLATSAGASLIGYISAAGSAIARTVQGIFGEVNRLTDFAGADPTGAADSTAAVLAWIAYGFSSGKRSHAPAGTYKVTSQVVMDWGTAAAAGVMFTGDGINRTVFDLSTVATAPAWLMTDTVGNKAAFAGSFVDIGIRGSVAGPVFQVGDEAYAAAFNEFAFKVQASNNSTSTSACAIELNALYNCDVFAVGNCAGHGDALRLRQTQFSRIFGSFGNADTGVHLTGGYSFGNLLTALDLEVVNTCVVIDSANATHNKWAGGQFVWSNGSGPAVAAINATAGSDNRFECVNYGSAGAITTGASGVTVVGKGIGSTTMGGLTVSPLSGDAVAVNDSVAGNTASWSFRTAGQNRWAIQRNNSSETGSNAGSNFIITRYSDAGASIDNPLSINRANGQTTITALAATTAGFFGAGVQATRPVVTGSRSGGAALTSLIGALSTLGLITDSTSA